MESREMKDTCAYPNCKCIVITSTSLPEPRCPLRLPKPVVVKKDKVTSREVADAVGLAINTITYSTRRGGMTDDHRLAITVLEKIKSNDSVMRAVIRALQ